MSSFNFFLKYDLRQRFRLYSVSGFPKICGPVYFKLILIPIYAITIFIEIGKYTFYAEVFCHVLMNEIYLSIPTTLIFTFILHLYKVNFIFKISHNAYDFS